METGAVPGLVLSAEANSFNSTACILTMYQAWQVGEGRRQKSLHLGETEKQSQRADSNFSFLGLPLVS